MRLSTGSKVLLPCAAVLVVSGVVLLAVVRSRPKDEEVAPPASGPAADANALFQERARESGIEFRMAFLPGEQGEKFKINLYDHGCGVAVGDFDGDGHDDVYFVNQLGRNALYRNRGDGTFEDVTERGGVGLGDRVCVGATFGDYLNDGRPALFVTSTRGGNVLFKNQGDGTFKDVTKEAGLIYVGHSQTAVFFDYDNDGYLDLFVTNTAGWTTGQRDPVGRYFPGGASLWQLTGSPIEHNKLYHNNHDGTFTDVTEKAGLQGKGWGGDVAVFDYDEDGYLDLLVTNMFGQSQLYHNNGDGTFRDVTDQTLGPTSFGAIGCKALDFCNDGRLGLLIVDMHSDMWVPTRATADMVKKITETEGKKYRFVTGAAMDYDEEAPKTEKRLAKELHIDYAKVIFGNTLYRNLGGGRFQEVSDAAGMETWWPWGVATGDFDNDGYEDVFLPSGMGYPYFYWGNKLMMNNGDGTFTDRAAAAGMEPPRRGIYLEEKIGRRQAARSSRCAAVADFDGDGRLDLVTNNFNDVPYYFRNHFPRRNYVAFRLQGTEANRDAVGALVKLHIGKEVMTRQVHGAGGYLSQSSNTVHFGLGSRAKIDRLEIRWPGSRKWPRGHVQTIVNPPLNRLHKLVEPHE